MKKFLELLDLCKRGVGSGDPELDTIISAQPFVISHDGTNTVVPKSSYEEIDPTKYDCLPFKVFSLEFDGGQSLVNLNVAGVNTQGIKITCVIFIERSPTEYSFIQLVEIDSLKRKFYTTVDNLADNQATDPKDEQLVRGITHKVLMTFLDALSERKIGSITVKERFKYKDFNGVKTEKVFRNIIVLGKNKTTTSDISYFGITPDWNHRWTVMGHWRKFSGTGKNREGEYCVEGYTWVKDHVRGPEDAPIVLKQRVLK